MMTEQTDHTGPILVVCGHAGDPAISFGIDRLQKAAMATDELHGYRVDVTMRATQLPAQGYRIIPRSNGAAVIGGGRAGAMYGLLRLAEMVRIGNGPPSGPEERRPYLANRGIKFNLPLDARTPGYSDDGDSAAAAISDIWSAAFWRELLDRMAEERYNLLSLWNLHPFPSMVMVPEYPRVVLDDVMVSDERPVAHTTGIGMVNRRTRNTLRTLLRMNPATKIEFWRQVMDYADQRCIKIMIFTWNVFTYGAEYADYGIDDRMDNPRTVDYIRASVRALLRTYPLLAGVGITAGEHMDRGDNGAARNQAWLRATYGAAVTDVLADTPERPLRLIHRSHWSDVTEVASAFNDVPVTAEFSYKYSAAHLHTDTRPRYIDRDRFLEQLPEGSRFWLTMRDDDYYILRPGDPAFIGDYLRSLPGLDRLNGFYFGPDGYTIARERLRRRANGSRELVFDRQWYLFSMIGQLAFDPGLNDDYFRDRLRGRYPELDSRILFDSWQAASQIVPLVNRFHFGGNTFDLDWYPEACLSHPRQRRGFHTIHDFIDTAPMPGSGLVGIGGAEPGAKGPEQVADDLEEAAGLAFIGLDRLTREVSMGAAAVELVDDIRALSELGRYYAHKIRGATAVHRVIEAPGDAEELRAGAVAHLENASHHWSCYAELVHRRYVPQRLSRLGGIRVDLRALQDDVDYDVTLARTAG